MWTPYGGIRLSDLKITATVNRYRAKLSNFFVLESVSSMIDEHPKRKEAPLP